MAAVSEFDPGRVQALLVDLDGVLYVGDDVIPGAPEALKALERRGIELRFVTNTTLQPRRELMARLHGIGLPVREGQLFTPAALGRRAMEHSGAVRYRLLGVPALAVDLGGEMLAPDASEHPDWVVLGLHPPSFCHERLTVGLRDLLGGARLLALHANRVWRIGGGMEIGLGAYVRALEHAARTEAVVVGKPAAGFFEQALADLAEAGVDRARVAMVGDDVDADVGGAQAVGVPGVLVRTGKFTERSLAMSGVEPAQIVDDIADLARRIGHT